MGRGATPIILCGGLPAARCRTAHPIHPLAPLQDVPFLQWMDGNENEPFSAMDKVADQTMPRWQDHGGSTVEREREDGPST